MGRPGIVYEQVKAAADALLASGENPSIVRVRQEIGTGSNTTVGMHLRRWHEELAQQSGGVSSSAMTEGVLNSMVQFWREAAEKAELRAREAEKAISSATVQVQQGHASLQKRSDGLAEELAELRRGHGNDSAHVRDLKAALQVSEAENTALAEQLRHAKQELAEQSTIWSEKESEYQKVLKLAEANHDANQAHITESKESLEAVTACYRELKSELEQSVEFMRDWVGPDFRRDQ